MLYTANYIDKTLERADEEGCQQRELQNIFNQLVELVHQGVYSMKKMYSTPLEDEILRTLGQADRIKIKESVNKDIDNTLSYQYTFIYKKEAD